LCQWGGAVAAGHRWLVGNQVACVNTEGENHRLVSVIKAIGGGGGATGVGKVGARWARQCGAALPVGGLWTTC
jgi:hypothetical protein